jgi:hypothetical protein
MAFVFRRVYLLTRSDDSTFWVLAAGAHFVKDGSITFMVDPTGCSGNGGGHMIQGKITKDDGAVIEVTEPRYASPGVFRVWRFTVLTKEIWVSLPWEGADREDVDVYAKLVSGDAGVQGHVLADLLPEDHFPDPTQSG